MYTFSTKHQLIFELLLISLSYIESNTNGTDINRNSFYYRLGEYVYLLGNSTTGMFTRLFTEIDGNIVLQNILEYNKLLQNLTSDIRTNRKEVLNVCKVIQEKGEPIFLKSVDFEGLKSEVLWRYAYVDKVRELMLRTRMIWNNFIKSMSRIPTS
uniref:Uncharacterized protein n=1 Tax=Clastoptera arizonana TaxID=38151 RepID=A0A1B6DCS2_9HEMI